MKKYLFLFRVQIDYSVVKSYILWTVGQFKESVLAPPNDKKFIYKFTLVYYEKQIYNLTA